jgi:hypothetical protein
VLGAHLAGEPVATRGFEEREAPLRAMNDTDLWDALHDRMADLNQVAEAGEEVASRGEDADVAWTGRTMKVSWFAEHMREELVLHGWDITGDEEPARARLAEPWMTTHSVLAVGRPLLAKGAKGLRPGDTIEARLRVAGGQDVLVTAEADRTAIALAEPEDPAVLETDYAARVLLLWGRRPADPSRIRSSAGAEALGRLRRLLSGYRKSVPVAAARHSGEVVHILRGSGHGGYLGCHLPALCRSGGEEPLQVALRNRRRLELCCSSRVGRVERGNHLAVVAGGVHGRIDRIRGRDPGASSQRQCHPDAAKPSGQFGQRQPHHLWIPSS